MALPKGAEGIESQVYLTPCSGLVLSVTACPAHKLACGPAEIRRWLASEPCNEDPERWGREDRDP